MSPIKIFCFGFGQVAKQFIKKLTAENKKIELCATSRDNSQMKNFENLNFQSFKFDGKNFDHNIVSKIKDANYILVSIPPVENTDIVIKNFQESLKNTKCTWATYLSATSVYGNHNGNWVDERSETNPTTKNGINRLNAENLWLDFSKKNNLPLQVFRLSGIYSEQNNILKRLKLGETKIIKKKNHYFSRVHIEDIANVLFYSLQRFRKNEIYNISDDQPASQEEVATYGSKILNIEKPELFELDSLEEGMLKDFYKDSKKVSNKKMKNFFNYNLIYPSYKQGLDNIFNNMI